MPQTNAISPSVNGLGLRGNDVHTENYDKKNTSIQAARIRLVELGRLRGFLPLHSASLHEPNPATSDLSKSPHISDNRRPQPPDMERKGSAGMGREIYGLRINYASCPESQ